MRRIVGAAAVACALSVSLFADITPQKLIQPHLVVGQPAVVGPNVTWVVRNTGNSGSAGTQLKGTCTAVYTEDPVRAYCSRPWATVAVPPLASGDSFTATVTDLLHIEKKTYPPRWRFSLGATVTGTGINTRNEANFIFENFQGPPPPPPPATATAGSNSAQVSPPPQFPSGPKMQFATDPVQWSVSAPFWLVLKNVDPAVDANNVVVTYKCELQPVDQPAKPVPCAAALPIPATWTVAAIPHGSFKALYQISNSIWPGSQWTGPGSPPPKYQGLRLTFHVTNGIAPDFVLSSFK